MKNQLLNQLANILGVLCKINWENIWIYIFLSLSIIILKLKIFLAWFKSSNRKQSHINGFKHGSAFYKIIKINVTISLL
jgi:hypothetical protein